MPGKRLKDYFKRPVMTNLAGTDFLGENAFYGRRNHNREPIFLSEAFLKPSKQYPNAMMLNFVTDAFDDFILYFGRLFREGRLDRNSIFSNITDAYGWENFHQLYHNHLESIYKDFNLYLARTKKKPRHFDHFVSLFLDFYLNTGRDVPLTRSGFITSNLSNPRISGLVVDLRRLGDMDNDDIKKQYFVDPHFQDFVRFAKGFGFLVDRNIPWRLTANVYSTKMLAYAEKYDMTLNNVFDRPYYLSYLTDLESSRIYIEQFFRSINSQSSISSSMSQVCWLSFYVQVRLHELNKTVKPATLKIEVDKIHALLTTLGEKRAFEYANDFVRNL